MANKHPFGNEWWACKTCGKRTYPTRRLAAAALRFLKRRGAADKDGKPVFRPYRSCCGMGWHIGHTEVTRDE